MTLEGLQRHQSTILTRTQRSAQTVTTRPRQLPTRRAGPAAATYSPELWLRVQQYQVEEPDTTLRTAFAGGGASGVADGEGAAVTSGLGVPRNASTPFTLGTEEGTAWISDTPLPASG